MFEKQQYVKYSVHVSKIFIVGQHGFQRKNTWLNKLITKEHKIKKQMLGQKHLYSSTVGQDFDNILHEDLKYTNKINYFHVITVVSQYV